MLTFAGRSWAISSSSVGRSKADACGARRGAGPQLQAAAKVPARRTVERDGETL